MNEDTFWQLLADHTPPAPDPEAELLADALTEHLARSPLHRIEGFAGQLSRALYRLDHREFGRAESLLHVPDRAYERVTGEEWPRDTRYSFESYSNLAGWAE